MVWMYMWKVIMKKKKKLNALKQWKIAPDSISLYSVTFPWHHLNNPLLLQLPFLQ